MIVRTSGHDAKVKACPNASCVEKGVVHYAKATFWVCEGGAKNINKTEWSALWWWIPQHAQYPTDCPDLKDLVSKMDWTFLNSGTLKVGFQFYISCCGQKSHTTPNSAVIICTVRALFNQQRWEHQSFAFMWDVAWSSSLISGGSGNIWSCPWLSNWSVV